ncbi:MAG: GTPase HflX [Candidatus Sericytochromatia bacterium]
MIETHKSAERAFIVGVKLQENSMEEIDDSLKELASLVDTAGAVVVESFVQSRHNIDSAFYIGIGKVHELKGYAENENIDTIIFDTELSPSQIKNLEKEIGKKILDRSWVILDIFANRAKTKEAKTQVELAQLKYFMPRLTRQWTHLSRQVGGGVGTKGPGETQLETDKRLIRGRIQKLEDELKDIEKQREFRRRSRKDEFKVSLVGYTNAGKSTLMNRLSNAGVLAEDRLFATLDSTTRVIELENKKKFLLSDTVGFIKKLPHNLVASFRSTLEEVNDADLLLHVIDISHKNFQEQMNTVEKVLRDLGAESRKTLYVFNKSDNVDQEELEIRTEGKYKKNGIFISAQTGFNVDNLLTKILEIMENDYQIEVFELNLKQSKIVSVIHSSTEVLEEEYLEDKVVIKAKAKKSSIDYIKSLF